MSPPPIATSTGIRLDCFGPASMIVGYTLKGVSDTQEDIFGKEVAQQLQPYRQAIAEAARDRDTADTCQVRRNGEYVLEIHFVRIRYLANLECHRWRGGTDQHIETFESAGEIFRDQRAHLLRLLIIGVVVAGGERVGTEHDAALDLLPEPKLAGLL